MMIALVLSGIRTLKRPSKNSHAASHASIARAVVSSKVGYTKRYRERTAVKIHARKRRRLRASNGSVSQPTQPVSTCTSWPGSPSSTGIVVAVRPNCSSRTAKRCRVGYGITTPWRARSLRILERRSSSFNQRRIVSRCSPQRVQLSPRGRPPAGCNARSTSRTCSSLTASPLGRQPVEAAARRYRRTVFGSRPSCAASRFFGTPSPQSRRTSLSSTIVTSRYIHASWLGTATQNKRPIARSGEGGKGFEKPGPEGGKGFEKLQSRGGKGFEKVVTKGSLGFENRQENRRNVFCHAGSTARHNQRCPSKKGE